MLGDRSNVAFEPFFGGFVVETLTIGMYGETRNAIREYIQNGFDSIQRATGDLKILSPGKGAIEIELGADRNSLTIRDNGAGLPVKSAAATLTRVGASNKSHVKNAGFRGIGRLAGIVFSDRVTFRTKARGERQETTVVFDAKAMRAAMAPGKGSTKSALDLMKECVAAYRADVSDSTRHYFEVRLEGFVDEPDECKSSQAMYDFVSQVAPVPFPDDFPYREKLREAEQQYGIPIEEVAVSVVDGTGDPVWVTKRYSKEYRFDSGTIALSDCTLYHSRTRRWWAWVGKKSESGSYTDVRVSGLRVRVRNIQIDGTDIIREIFRDHAKSHVRFQDYFVGEVFIRPDAVVPNARRDGFEEDAGWKRLRRELVPIVRGLGKEAYQVSKQGQLSVSALKSNLEKSKRELSKIRRGEFTDTNAIISLSKRLTTYQNRVGQAIVGADMEAAAQLQAIGAGLADLRQEALSHVASAANGEDRERIQEEAREEFFDEILVLLEDVLSPGCYAEVHEALLDEYRAE